MTPSAVAHTDAIERALAHATEVAVTWGIETQVFGDRDGRCRVAIGGVQPIDEEVVVATVGANGEMLIYGLGRAGIQSYPLRPRARHGGQQHRP